MTDFDLMPERNGRLDLPDTPAGPDTGVDVAYVPAEKVDTKSDLDLLRAELATKLEETVLVPVPTRPGYTIRCLIDVSGDELDTWRKLAKSKKHTDGVDGMKLNALLLANKTTEIVRNGQRLVDGYGEALSFRHREFIALLKETPREELTAAAAVRRFFGRDGAVDAAARTVLTESGWGDDLAPDPTVAD